MFGLWIQGKFKVWGAFGVGKISFFIKKKRFDCDDGDGTGIPKPIGYEVQFLIIVENRTC